MSSQVAVVVGNPKPRSRTLTVATAVADAAARAAGFPSDADRLTIDLADHASELFDWSSAVVRGLVEGLQASTLAVVATPTYKASYTGLLKAFLDWFDPAGLAGVTVVPVMLGAGPQHALAVEVHLRPVLVEIGATIPTRGLYVLEDQLADLDGLIDAWLVHAAAPLRASTH